MLFCCQPSRHVNKSNQLCIAHREHVQIKCAYLKLMVWKCPSGLLIKKLNVYDKFTTCEIWRAGGAAASPALGLTRTKVCCICSIQSVRQPSLFLCGGLFMILLAYVRREAFGGSGVIFLRFNSRKHYEFVLKWAWKIRRDIEARVLTLHPRVVDNIFSNKPTQL